MTINDMHYKSWFKWKKWRDSNRTMGTPSYYPIELHRLKQQNYLDEQEFARVKQMLDSPDKENVVIAEQILLTLRKKRLRGLR